VTNDIYPSRKFQVPIQPRARVETVQERPESSSLMQRNLGGLLSGVGCSSVRHVEVAQPACAAVPTLVTGMHCSVALTKAVSHSECGLLVGLKGELLG
jgi:hypothetical protein